MLRVLTLSTLFPDASRPNFGVFVERQTLGLASLPDTQVTVVAPLGLPPPLFARLRYAALATLPRRETRNGLDVHRPRFLNLPGTQGRWHAPLLTRALRPLLDGLSFDVIDASFFFPDGPAAIALGRRYGVPVSIKARGADIHHWGRAPATARQVLAAGRDAQGLLAVSAAMRDDMVALGMPADRIRVHHTGVDQDRFAPADRAAAKAAIGVAGPLVVSTGALIPRKGHDIVIEAVASLPGVTLLIAGEGPERPRLQALIARLGVADRVRLAGSIPHDLLPDLLAAADVFALASASEGLANAWVEALACGVPIVITDAGGAREVVTAPNAGRIAERTPAAFASAMAELLASPSDPQAVRAHARRFTWEANARALREHLAGLVQSSG
ncbi:glycosyltransferase [Sphingomonas lenta]|uniref:Glycoside hydrolase n=1 Tax=Sphingomonas lenta TaxID=1141887 RepID=A0A2A2SG25_9SPHN|nr:glycosyltransferase [Sphingomonas lenta]PAX08254.1 glycoside hydrolase [Sphingomonas lenta]